MDNNPCNIVNNKTTYMKAKETLEIVTAEKNNQLAEMTSALGRVACSILESLNGFSLFFESEERWSISLGPFIIVDEEILGSYTHEDLDLDSSVERFSVDFIGAVISNEFNSGMTELGTEQMSPRFILG